MNVFLIFAVLIVSSIILAGSLKAQSWSKWEAKNSVARHGQFLVIRQPDVGGCYVAQSYSNDVRKMSLRFKGEGLFVNAPHRGGLRGKIQYWVDEGPRHELAQSNIDSPTFFIIPGKFVPKLRTGRQLTILADRIGYRFRMQKFSLAGFSAAANALRGSRCMPINRPVTSNLTVKVERLSDGKLVVRGNTKLPNGMVLGVSVWQIYKDFFHHKLITVRDNTYIVGPFDNNGRQLSAGDYQINISSPLHSFQTPTVQKLLGQNGIAIPRELGQKHYGQWSVGYSVVRSVQ